MAVIGRVVVYIILTLIVQFVILKFYDILSPSDIAVFKLVSYAIAAILLILAGRQYSKMSAYQVRAEMAQNPGRFSPDKLDCYVCFQGKLTAGNAYALPFSSKTCAFYQAEVFAEWQTKRKRPAKGMETQRKPLFRDQSSVEMELVAGEQRIYVRAEDFTQSGLWLHQNEKIQRQCPEQIKNLFDRKYETYQITEYFACSGDTITVQGKLTRSMDGRLFVKPTGRLKFPSFVDIRMQRTNAAKFAKEIADKALRHVRIKQISIAALIINAILLFYISFTLNNTSKIYLNHLF